MNRYGSIAAVVLASWVSGLDLSVSAHDDRSRTLDARSIHMVIQAGGDVGAEEVRDTFDRARGCTPGCSVQKVRIDAIDPNAYAVLELIVRGERVPPSPPPSDECSGRCYLVTLEGIGGDVTELFATLRDPLKIPSPARFFKVLSPNELVIGTFADSKPPPRPSENEIVLAFPKPANIEPKRMWMRFPLTSAEQAALSKELDERFAENGPKTVPDWIRQNLLGERLTPEGSPGWFELPWNEEHQAFERTLPIDTKAWQERLVNNGNFMGQNSILIYEFEGEDGAWEIIKGENGKYYLPYEVPGWLTGLPGVPTKSD